MLKAIWLAAGLALTIGGSVAAQTVDSRIYVRAKDAKEAKAVAAAGAAIMASLPIYVRSKDLDARVAKTREGLASAQVPTGSPDHVVMIAHRTADGEVEVHTKLADEIIVRTGHAKIRVGGKVSGQRETAPNEFRGGTMTGGEVYDLSPGDAIYVPVGQPHQVLVPRGGQITYTAAKFPG